MIVIRLGDLLSSFSFVNLVVGMEMIKDLEDVNWFNQGGLMLKSVERRF